MAQRQHQDGVIHNPYRELLANPAKGERNCYLERNCRIPQWACLEIITCTGVPWRFLGPKSPIILGQNPYCYKSQVYLELPILFPLHGYPFHGIRIT